ncbi:hypothetical protein ACHAW5_010921 [Stephanodiscus triporus]|uniref:Uncharacterized protein n=1 Tax=Stephanodiscus triporus TaxID=2934178 RepID=A0ABD3PCM1_9STRA
MWRTGLSEDRSTVKSRRSCDSAMMSHSYTDCVLDGMDNVRDDTESIREDVDCVRDEGTTMDGPGNKLMKFDEMMNRIKVERRKIATPEVSSMAEKRTPSSNRSTTSLERRTPSPAYSFASRAMELKMSDGVPARSNRRLEMMPPNGGCRPTASPIQSSTSTLGLSTPRRQNHDYRPWSASNTSLRSSSPARSPSLLCPTISHQEGFKDQVNKFHTSLVTAHDTITTLERDVDNLKRSVYEKDESILSLNDTIRTLKRDMGTLSRRVNEKDDLISSLNCTLKRMSDEVGKLEVEREAILEEKDANSRRHVKELENFDTMIAAIQDEKKKSVNGIKEKEAMIENLRLEIQRLNEELEDGSIVRSQALKAEETAKKLQEELDKSKANDSSSTKAIVDLENRLKEKSEELDRRLAEKDKKIATLQSELLTLQQMPELLKDKSSKLDESNQLNAELSDKVKNIEKHLENAELVVGKKDTEIKQLKSTILESDAREKVLQKELKHQRERFERYEENCAAEQETVFALERAIEELEGAHGERTEEITRLQAENHSLSTTLAEAGVYMEMYQNDLKESSKLKGMVGELQETNDDLGQRLNDKEEVIGKLESHLALIEKQLELRITSLKELEVINADLRQQLQNKDVEMEAFQSRIATIENQVMSNATSSHEAILKLSSTVADKENLIAQLQGGTSSAKEFNDLCQQLQNKDDDIDKLQAQVRTVAASSKEAITKLKSLVSQKEEVILQLQGELYTKPNQLSQETAFDSEEDNELKSELAYVKEKLTERDEELVESRKSIAEAQKMIFRLMNTVQEMRKVPMKAFVDSLIVAQTESSQSDSVGLPGSDPSLEM